ncbi:hypothetical protein PanWU01x14_146480 [Parasponia andersonii]|uniref:Uncharacterized protein n=1 Tax=Parasponia andersonii TaxID=3476 RepID=A0A2P5CJQ4_PARAD|nr:hypothetical protein PanWU01x14_146480 [Parasponia andersonii]
MEARRQDNLIWSKNMSAAHITISDAELTIVVIPSGSRQTSSRPRTIEGAPSPLTSTLQLPWLLLSCLLRLRSRRHRRHGSNTSSCSAYNSSSLELEAHRSWFASQPKCYSITANLAMVCSL